MHIIHKIFLILFVASVCTAQQSSFFQSIEFTPVLDSMNFPEGPAFDGNKTLFVSSCYGGFIKKVSADGSEIFVKADSLGIKQTNGLAFRRDGALYACDFGRGVVLKIGKDRKIEIVSGGYEGRKFNRPNDLAFDKKGNLYFSDPKTSDTLNPDGRLFRINAVTGSTELMLSGIAYPNGLAFTPDGKTLYLCESAKNQILKFKVDSKGKLSNKTVFVKLPGGAPDGIALDVKLNLYAAHFAGGNIYVISPGGKILENIPTPGKKPSNLEFAGKDMKTLYITEDETNKVYSIRTKIEGMRLFGTPVKK